MAIKELQTRIALKYDSYANWMDESKEGQGAKLVLLPGELGICYIGDTNQESNVVPTVLFKVGDGKKTFKELPWASAKAADVYSWAKASDVVYNQTAKTITFVKGNVDGSDKVITFNYVTLAEVQAITNGLDSRITALEGKFTGTDSVQGQIDALDGRLDVIEGSGEGSVAKALTDAKAYTDEREVEIKKYADQAEADAKSYTDGEVDKLEAADLALDGRLGVIEGEGEGSVKKALVDAKAYADGKAATAEQNAKDYADGLAGNYDAAGAAATAEQNAKTYTDGEVDKLEAEDLRLAGLIGGNTTAIGNEVSARESAVSAINTKIGAVTEGKDVVTMISDAQSAAVTSANGYTDGKVSDLENGQVKTNKDDIAGLKAADTEIRGLISAEQSRAEGIEGGLRSDVDNIKAFFATAEGETLDTALDTLKEIQDYLNGEGTATNGIIGRVAQAETDIDNLEKEFNTDSGRVKVAEGKISALEAADTRIDGRIDALVGTDGTIATGDAATLEAAKTYAKDYADGLAGNYDAAGSAAAAETAAKGYTDGKVSELSSKDTEIEGKVTTLQNIVDGYTTKGSIKTAVDAAAELAQKGVDDAKTADDKAVAAQGTADAVKAAVEHETTGLAATKVIADRADAKSIANAGRLDTAEGNITTLQGIVQTGADSNVNLRSAITDLQTLTGTNGAIRNEIAAAKKAGDDAAAAVDALSKGQVATNKSNIEGLDSRVTAIENDYLKAADVYIFNCGSSTLVTHEAPKAE